MTESFRTPACAGRGKIIKYKYKFINEEIFKIYKLKFIISETFH